jgi:hypothetical protein
VRSDALKAQIQDARQAPGSGPIGMNAASVPHDLVRAVPE